MAWLDEGLSRVNQIRRGAIECSDWSRDSWGVELRNGMARIYSLYDEDCSAAIALDDFERALLGWKRFICSGQPIPDSGLSFSSATAGGNPSLN
ncbi:hypothetical protein HW10_30035 [Pseudomonas aeruginosa]|nr:hypothetical protein HW10_30035 [Pseudomonas aeruginosa]